MPFELGFNLKLALAGKLSVIAGEIDDMYRQAAATVFKRRLTALKNAVRREIIAAGLGQRLANAIRSRLFRTSAGELGGAVFSNARLRRPGGRVDLISAFQGDISVTGNGKYFAVNLTDQRSGRDNRSRATPGDYPDGTFQLVPTHRAGTFRLVDKRSGDTVFLLIRRFRIGRRLSDFAVQFARATKGLDEAVAKEMERRLVQRFKRAA